MEFVRKDRIDKIWTPGARDKPEVLRPFRTYLCIIKNPKRAQTVSVPSQIIFNRMSHNWTFKSAHMWGSAHLTQVTIWTSKNKPDIPPQAFTIQRELFLVLVLSWVLFVCFLVLGPVGCTHVIFSGFSPQPLGVEICFLKKGQGKANILRNQDSWQHWIANSSCEE